MKYRLFAADFDGTLYEGEMPHIPEENRKAIEEYRRRGGKFLIATGRMYRSIRPYAIDLDLKDELIAYQGATVYDVKNSALLLNIPIKTDQAAEILLYIEEKGYHCQIYNNDIYYIVENNDYAESYSRFCGIPINLTHIPLSEYVLKGGIEPTKMMVIMDRDKLNAFYIELKDQFKGKYGFARSSDNFIEITNSRANKGVALKFIAHRYGIRREEVAAIGDSTNDLAMIEYAGLGIAVGNAMEELKKASRLVTVNAGDNAVAKVLNMIMRDEL